MYDIRRNRKGGNKQANMRLAGLDFETANNCAGSICAVGCGILQDGGEGEMLERLVRPHPSMNWIASFCYRVHGIGACDLEDAEEFPSIWPELRDMLLSADCVVIHNAPFDLGHLRAVLSLYGLPPVQFPYVCSLTASRRALPELASHSLNSVAAYFDIRFRHHDALEDALTCAKVMHEIGLTPRIPRKEFVYPVLEE